MRIGVLGPLEIRTEAGEVHLPHGAKQRLLLAGLLLHLPRAVPVDRLIELLWAERPPSDPTSALRTHLSRLRSFLKEAGAGDCPLRREPNGYRLAPDCFELDADRFQGSLRQTGAVGTPAGELALLDEALELWRGEAFEDFRDHPRFLGSIRRLEELRTGALERRVECLLEVGRIADALAAAEPLVQDEPLRERPRALLMIALYRSGRAHEGLDAFRDYRRSLSEELGLDPSPPLRRLQEAILRHEPLPELRASALSLPPGSASPGPERVETPREESAPVRAVHSRARADCDDLRQTVRFCRSGDGVRLAYATVGSGPPLVKAANWLNHIEFDWQSPVWRRLFRELATGRTLIRYDERGSGLSDWDVDELSLDAWVLDLEAVVNACRLDRFALLGISQGCAVCIRYAAEHPERVAGLVLHGGYAAGWRADPRYPAAEVARRDASIEIVRHGWGEDTPAYRQMFTQTFIPGGTPEEVEWFNELERRSVSPENAARFMEAFAYIDVRDHLAEVKAPTLVLHSRGDQRIHYEMGGELATGIPGARFVMLESSNHLILEHEPAFEHWIGEVRRFLAEEVEL